MEDGQSPTISKNTTTPRGLNLSDITSIDMLSPQQLQWVDYCVVQGLMTGDDGEPSKMSVTEFSHRIGIAKSTLYEWKKIPRFWEYVAARRNVIFSQTRTQKVWNSLYMAATTKLDVRAIQTFLANADPNFVMPSQNVQHEAGDSLSELLLAVRARKQKQNQIQEGEIVGSTTNPDD